MPPTSRLRAVARRLCTPRTMERLIDPLLADIRHEAAAAAPAGRAARLIASFRGYVAFWKAVSVYVPLAFARAASAWWQSGGTTRAGLIAAVVTLVFATGLGTATPLLSVTPGRRVPMLFLLLLPQSLPLSLPLVLFAGVAAGCRGRLVSRRMTAAILAAALTGSVVSFGTINWVVPAANQAFREAASGGPLPRGPAEWSPRFIRAEALAMGRDGLARQAGSLLLEYHARWALVGTTLTFALFGLAVARVGGLAAALMMSAVPYAYMNYLSALTTISGSLLSDERYAVAAAWVPNTIVILASVAVLMARDSAVETG